MNKKNKIAFIWALVLSPFFLVFFLVSLASFEFFGPLPTFDQLENPKNNLATEIISADSVVLGKYFFVQLAIYLSLIAGNNQEYSM